MAHQPSDSLAPQSEFSREASFGYALVLLSRLVSADYYRRVGRHEVKFNQFFLMFELWVRQPQSQIELAGRLNVGKAAVGESLSNLENLGYVRRRASEVDRRSTLVSLTEQGRVFVEHQALQKSVEQNDYIRSIIGAERFNIALEVMQQVSLAMEMNKGV